MPELPDVEVFKRYLDATSLHKTIAEVTVNNDTPLGDMSQDFLREKIKGRRFESSVRHGKNLFVQLDRGGWLRLHFGMTGRLKYYKDGTAPPEYGRVVFDFSNGFHLAFVCQRMFGRISFAPSVERFIEDKSLGPDALDLGAERLKEIIGTHRGKLKTTLMNQHILAGLGNVYVDEILFHAKLAPDADIKDLSEEQVETLHRTMRDVLKVAIERHADPTRFPKDYLTPHRSESTQCPVCSGRIAKKKIGQRSTYFCPNCQPGTS